MSREHGRGNELDKEIEKLTEQEQGKQDREPFKARFNAAEIKKTLKELTENAESGISHDLIRKFVSRVTPTSDTSFDWYVKLGVARRTKATYTVKWTAEERQNRMREDRRTAGGFFPANEHAAQAAIAEK